MTLINTAIQLIRINHKLVLITLSNTKCIQSKNIIRITLNATINQIIFTVLNKLWIPHEIESPIDFNFIHLKIGTSIQYI